MKCTERWVVKGRPGKQKFLYPLKMCKPGPKMLDEAGFSVDDHIVVIGAMELHRIITRYIELETEALESLIEAGRPILDEIALEDAKKVKELLER